MTVPQRPASGGEGGCFLAGGGSVGRVTSVLGGTGCADLPPVGENCLLAVDAGSRKFYNLKESSLSAAFAFSEFQVPWHLYTNVGEYKVDYWVVTGAHFI